MNELFDKLEQYRINNNLTVTKLTKLVGIGRTTYYDWKNGKPPAKLAIYLKVEEFLKNE